MTESELRKLYLAWWQPRNPRGRLWPNRSGFFKSLDNKRVVACGIPPPTKKKDGAGGSDMIGWNNDGVFTARELKTTGDTLKENQADFLTLAKNCGCDAALVVENPYSATGFDEIKWNGNMKYLVK